MTHYVVFAQTPEGHGALGACLALLGADAGSITHLQVPQYAVKPERIAEALEDVASRLDAIALRTLERTSPRPIVALVDSISPNDMNLISDAGGWSHFIALIVVTFPDIWWVFGAATERPSAFPDGEHSIASLFSDVARVPLFDPTGLRDWIRARTNACLESEGFSFRLPRRRHRAAAIDEERAYSFMHAYTAYRYGYRAEAIHTWANTHATFGPHARCTRGRGHRHGHDYRILLEDMSLNFPDRTSRALLLCLADRAKALPYLDSREPTRENSMYRILITSGREHPTDKSLAANVLYLKEKTPEESGWVEYKPLGGITELWRKARQDSVAVGQRRGNATGFEWPPRFCRAAQIKGHGAPGRLGLVSELLLRRALATQGESGFVQDFLVGAGLAGDAAELVGGFTPTLAFSAIAARHELEVQAECVFGGAGMNLKVDQRADEIGLEIRLISQLFHPDQSRQVNSTSCSVILNRLAIIFRERGYFEEEMDMLKALRRQLRDRSSRYNPLGWIARYTDWLVASPLIFLLAIGIWLAILWGGWHLLGTEGQHGEALSGVLSGFFGGNAATPESSIVLILWSGFAAALGLFHLGILLSHLYALVLRR